MSCPFPMEETKYGFEWGPMVVERVLSDERVGVVVQVRTRGGPGFEVRVTPKGKKIDVLFKSRQELP